MSFQHRFGHAKWHIPILEVRIPPAAPSFPAQLFVSTRSREELNDPRAERDGRAIHLSGAAPGCAPAVSGRGILLKPIGQTIIVGAKCWLQMSSAVAI